MRHKIAFLFLGFFIFFSKANAVCTVTSPVAFQLSAICIDCMFPIKLAGVSIVEGDIIEGANRVNKSICKCPGKWFGYPQIGIPIGYYSVDRILDVVIDPFCFPSLGFQAKSGGASSFKLGGEQGYETGDNATTFYQVHEIYYLLSAILELFTDILCMTSNSSLLDIGYLTEFDPMWQSSTLSAIIQPEAILFNNPVTNLACITDAVSSQVNFPLDPLFWCKGSWGNTYPLSGFVSKHSLVEDSASIASTFIFKMHRELLTWNSSGISALCFAHPLPFWIKSSNRLQFIAPMPNFTGMSIGRSGIIWEAGKNIPFVGENFSYLWFRKHDCCAL
ncbi:TraU family protein [Campylobacter sp. MG1]|uniref:TraU family protein n=1 Tax=Campylobacter sp. MG1 TaxID=2976332 RepID=UPI00226CEFA5|nr:TraU family protein [Campylobacter sp. MG1]